MRIRAFVVPFAAVTASAFMLTSYGVSQETTLPTVQLSPGQAQPITCTGGRLVGQPSLVRCIPTTTSSSTTTTAGPTSTTSTTVAPTSTTLAPTSTTVAPTSTTVAPTTTTVAPTTTTSAPSGANCTDPVWSSSDAEGTDNIDSNDGSEYWWVDNDAWSGGAGPQSIYVCNQSSWYAVSDQPDNGGAVETYPNTEYDVGGRSNGVSTEPISAYNSITSTFSEDFPSAGSWDAAYDLWLNNWSTEIMIWNQWSGSQGYWPGIATTSVTLDGVGYKFYDNGGELMFFRDTQVSSGSVDILAAFNWLVSNGYVSASDAPTQLEYGVEVCATSGSETFPLTGLSFSLS